LNDYSRVYLTPYKQKHPTTDHQYTLFYEIISADEVYFVLVKDDSCLHDTRGNHDDPCLKKFQKLRTDKDLETFDNKLHKPQFEVQPDKKKPFRCRSRYLGYEITLNSTSIDGNKSFFGHAFGCDDPHPEIARKHTKDFLKDLHGHILANKLVFEIRITREGNAETIDLLENAFEPTQWSIVDDEEEFILQVVV
jgi:hypothetical protein